MSCFAMFSEVFKALAPQPEAATSTRRPEAAMSRRCGTSSVWLRRKRTRKTALARGLKKMAVFFATSEVEGGFGANSFNILKFGAERDEFVGFLLHLLYSWT